MIGRSTESLVYQLQRVAADFDAAVPDSALLRRFQQYRDPTAFELLVWRHGAMVQAVCRRVLGQGADVDDAFQATFLVLLQQSRSIRNCHSLASWLHGVALRVALRRRRDLLTQRRRERAASRSEAQLPPDFDRSELGPILHAEIARLPERLRQPFVLCEVEGRSDAEAAEMLAVPDGTVRSRLSRAREHLRRRLAQRGVAFGAAGFASILAAEPVSASLVTSAMTTTLQPSAAATPGAASALAKGVIQEMVVRKIKMISAAVLAGSLVLGIGLSMGPRWTSAASAADVTVSHPTTAAQAPEEPPAGKADGQIPPTAEKPKPADRGNLNEKSPLDLMLSDKPFHAFHRDEIGIIGVWKMKSANVGSTLRDPDDRILTFGPFGTLLLTKGVDAKEVVSMSYKLHPETRPIKIELTAGGKTQEGYYDLADDQLRIFLGPGSTQPKDGGNGAVAFCLEREKNTWGDTKWAAKMFENDLSYDLGRVDPTKNAIQLHKFKFKNIFDRPVRILSERRYMNSVEISAKNGWIEPGEEDEIEFKLNFANWAGRPTKQETFDFSFAFVVKGMDTVQWNQSIDAKTGVVIQKPEVQLPLAASNRGQSRVILKLTAKIDPEHRQE